MPFDGQRLKEKREAAELSQEKLAEKLNIHPTTLSGWETGRHQPKLAEVIAVCNYFNCTTDELLGRTGIHYGGTDAPYGLNMMSIFLPRNYEKQRISV